MKELAVNSQVNRLYRPRQHCSISQHSSYQKLRQMKTAVFSLLQPVSELYRTVLNQ
jgi:hypothetical protein